MDLFAAAAPFGDRYCTMKLLAELFVLAMLPLLGGGCTFLRVGAVLAPPPLEDAQYTRFAGQSVAVMTWTDQKVRIDHPDASLDLSNALQNMLLKQTGKDQPFFGSTFPLTPQAVVKFQTANPAAEFAPVESTAVRLKVSRLIYIELDDLTTRTDSAGELFLGTATASIKVVEIAGGSGAVVYEERGIEVRYPPKAPPEGTLKGSDIQMYVGTIATLAERLSMRFIPHEME
jgi:hypothetical protein